MCHGNVMRFINTGYRLLRAPFIFPFRQKSNTSIMERNYQAAVTTLNSLQSSASTLERARLLRHQDTGPSKVSMTVTYLNRLGLSLDDLDRKFHTVHVAGTKGKGSTCAFCESILRRHGLRTGFYSSPHLVEVRERIRIDGAPLTRQAFADYFWRVYDQLAAQQDDLPTYFHFLTVMAFYVFVEERVDAAVIETGIGGLHDCTNVIRNPTVVGVSSLGLDHVSLLGDTVEKIAVHKAGIMKSGVPAFTVADQPAGAMDVLTATASRVQCPLYVVPELEAYRWGADAVRLGLAGSVQRKNAALALQLSRAVLQRHRSTQTQLGEPFAIESADALGLALASWPGRWQTLREPGASFYLDGAHTAESVEACAGWFAAASASASLKQRRRALVFNTTGDRDAGRILAPLRAAGFHLVVFCPNVMAATDTAPKDLLNLMVTSEQQVSRCQSNMRDWLSEPQPADQQVVTVATIDEALQRVRQFGTDSRHQVDVLVTGSLHLVGGALSLLDPELTRAGAEAEPSPVVVSKTQQTK